MVDERARSVTRAGTPVTLTATEFKLLAIVVRNRTRIAPKSQLLAQSGGTTPRTTCSTST